MKKKWIRSLVESRFFLVAALLVIASWAYIVTMPSGHRTTLYVMALVGLLRLAALTAMAFYGWRVLIREPRRKTASLGAALIAICGFNYILLTMRTVLTVARGEVAWWQALFSTQPDLRGGIGSTITSAIGATGVAIFLHTYENHIPPDLEECDCSPKSSKIDLLLPAGWRR